MTKRLGISVLGVMLFAGAAAWAVEDPLPGRTSAVKAGRLFKFLSTNDPIQPAVFPLPVPGGGDDPTVYGAQIRVFDRDFRGAGDFTHDLPAAGWRGLGSPPGARGYLYRGAAAGDPICRIVLLKDSVIKAICKHDSIPLHPPFLAEEGIIIGIPTSAAGAARRYCTQFGGREQRNDARTMRRKDAAAPATCPTPPPRTNLIVINLDDTRADGVDLMPVLLQRVAGEGVWFSESFASFASCTPSRASLLTGQYAFHHGTRQIAGPLGGADTFRESGADQRTIAVWLQAAGYATGLFGKYLNDYSVSEQNQGPGGTFYVPPGWERWRAFVSPERYGGLNGMTYSIVDESGGVTVYDDHTSDAQYSTDTTATWMREFIQDAVADGRPFFALWTPYASHSDTPGFAPIPAARHLGLFAGLSVWRPPNFLEPDVTDKPRWVASLGTTDPFSFTDAVRRRAYESLLAVDEQLALTLDLLDQLGIAEHTAVVLTSDNGAGWGEHRMIAQYKGCPYEECIRVPLAVRYPRAGGPVPAAYDTPVANVDLAPTLAALAGVAVPVAIDGHSFHSWLTGVPDSETRSDFLLEMVRLNRNDAISYSGQPADGDQLRLFHGDPRAKPRPSTLFEFDLGDGVDPAAVAVPIGVDEDATFQNLGSAIPAHVPQTNGVNSPASNIVTAVDQTPQVYGVYWWLERNQAGAIQCPNELPDFFGVRDVAAGYEYVEYETDEVELYDLDVDPWQLDNRADDPTYVGVRAALADRLRVLLAPP